MYKNSLATIDGLCFIVQCARKNMYCTVDGAYFALRLSSNNIDHLSIELVADHIRSIVMQCSTQSKMCVVAHALRIACVM